MPAINDKFISQMGESFIPRNDGLNRMGSLISSYLALPGLRGFWPMSSVAQDGIAVDQSGGELHLTRNNNVFYSSENLIPYAEFDGVADYLNRADSLAFDILGTETYVQSTGLTIGAWFNPTGVSGGSKGIAGKITGTQSSYLLSRSGDQGVMTVSGDGSTLVTVTGGTLTAGQWHFMTGRFQPSASLDLFVNGTEYNNIAGVPATIFDSTTDFEVGRQNSGNYIDGKISMVFLCVGALSDELIFALFEQGRVLYGV